MVLSQAQKKKDKSPKEGCLTGQRLLEMGAELFFPGSERGQREGGHRTRRGGGGLMPVAQGRMRAQPAFPFFVWKRRSRGGGDTGGMQGRIQGCVSPSSGEQLIPSPNPNPLTSSPGTEPTRLNCAHLADENSTARDLEILNTQKGEPREKKKF